MRFELEFFHFNTHFDHRGVRALSESASLLCRRFDEVRSQLPCIVPGDFIGDERSEVYALLTDYLEDTYLRAREGHYGRDASFFGGGFAVTEAAGERLDYVFSRGGLPTKRHAILSDSWNGFYPSDHLPVLAEFSIPSTP